MKPTDIARPDYFHKVVDCQWACPAHTPVPEYIRMIAAGKYDAKVRVVDMAPTLAKVLGIKPLEKLDGVVLTSALRK